MNTIFKTKLDICSFQRIELPQNFKILHIDKQNGVPCIWYECDSDMPIVKLDIYCVSTGYRMDGLPPLVYIGTVQIDGYVWHYYRSDMDCDERIRKDIIHHIEFEYNHNIVPRQRAELWIAWLEKQGEKGTNGNEREIPISEQKPADKVEPKFKVGDWITDGEKVWKIGYIEDDMYIEHCGTISAGGAIKSIDKHYHLWTIQDAKDGDVLQLGEVTAIFEAFTDNEKCECYCYCSVYNGEFEIPSQEGDDNIYGCHNAIPATKEQRELLFQKMKEAGYEWDAAMKELKKIEHNPAWSEEDEERYISCLQRLGTGNPEQPETINSKWFKEHVYPQSYWRPSDEQIRALDAVIDEYNGYPEFDSLVSLKNDLKKLMEE